jgi:hypothetical protein
MRKLLSGLLLIAAAEGAALACSCIAPGSPEESRPFARQAVQRAVAIVEADVLSEYRPSGLGEQVRVRQVLWGEAPREFRIARREFASSASCDLLLTRGERKILILYSPEDSRLNFDGSQDARDWDGQFAIQNLCSDFLLSDRGYLAVTLEEARRLRDDSPTIRGERG